MHINRHEMNNKQITSKLLKEAVKALSGIVKHPQFGSNIPLREIRIHMLDEDGDGINLIMCIYGDGMVQIPSLLDQGKWR